MLTCNLGQVVHNQRPNRILVLTQLSFILIFLMYFRLKTTAQTLPQRQNLKLIGLMKLCLENTCFTLLVFKRYVPNELYAVEYFDSLRGPNKIWLTWK